MSRATVGGIGMEYDVHGRGEPVLLVHGFPLSRRLWDPLVRELGGEYRLIVPDLRGHGGSEASGSATMRRYARDLVELLDHVGESRPVVVVGLSMGGYIAFELLRRHRERVRALVLANTRAGRDSPDAAAARLETADRVLREGSGVVADGMADRLFAPGAPDALRRRWHGIMAATDPVGVAAALRAMAARVDSRRLLRRVERPVLVVAGTDDAIIGAADARAMVEAAPRAKLRVVPGAGHMTPVEKPAEFAGIVRDFLAALPAAP